MVTSSTTPIAAVMSSRVTRVMVCCSSLNILRRPQPWRRISSSNPADEKLMKPGRGLGLFRPGGNGARPQFQEEISMARELVAHNKPVFDHLHRAVYATAIGLVAWYVLAAWLLFDRKDDIGLPLA